MMLSMEREMFACVRGTALGFPVVPEVWRTRLCLRVRVRWVW